MFNLKTKVSLKYSAKVLCLPQKDYLCNNGEKYGNYRCSKVRLFR